MADETLTSNIILKTEIPRPNREGFRVIKKDLNDISSKIKNLTSKEHVIKIRFESQIAELQRILGGGKGGGRGGRSGGGTGAVGSGGGGRPGGGVPPSGFGAFGRGSAPSGRPTSTRVIRTRDQETGQLVDSRSVEIVQRVNQELAQTVKTTRDLQQAGQPIVKQEEEFVNDVQKANDALTRREKILKGTTQKREKLRAPREELKQEGKITDEILRQEFAQVRLNEVNRIQNNLLDKTIQGKKGAFNALPVQKFTDTLTGATHEIRTFFRVTRKGVADYAVEIAELNTKTGELRQRTITGAQAIRFLGDSVARAAEKVALWLSATSIIFFAIRTFQRLRDEIIQLEAQTIFLARVGKNLGDNWDTQLSEARLLTDQIVNLTAAIGGNAIAAQEAASIFLRAGASRQEALAGVKAALLASRIAELEVVEAAQLLSSALLQFNMTASSLIPTLDSLNTLSNNYRVTTDDLLQSISRAGSVYADHKGTLEELAATTAIVSEVTSRTGTQIGNAIKTIVSRSDRLEVQQQLFDKLGISTVNLSGESKSLSQILTEISIRFDDLSVSEQKALTLSIAGVRQRNILIATLNNQDKILAATNKALLEDASAMKEFNDSSATLEASLARLNAEFTRLANSSRGPLGVFLKTLTELTTGLLRFLNIFQGTPAVILSLLSVFAILRLSLGFIDKKFKLLTNTIRIASTVQRHFSAETLRAGMSLQQQATFAGRAIIAIRGFSAAVGAAGVALKALLTPMNLLTVGLVALSAVMANSAKAELELIQSAEDAKQANERALEAERKKAQAIQQTTDAISRLIAEQDRLARSEREADRSRVRTLGERAKFIGESAGISIEIDPATGRIVKEDFIQKAAQAEFDQHQKVIEKQLKLFDENQKKLKELQSERNKKLKQIVKERKFDLGTRVGDAARSFGRALNPFADREEGESFGDLRPLEEYANDRIEALQNRIKEIDAEMKKLRLDAEEAERIVGKALTQEDREAAMEAHIERMERFHQALKDARDAMFSIGNVLELQAINQAARDLGGFEAPLQGMISDYRTLTKESERLAFAINEIKTIQPEVTELLAGTEKALNEVLQERLKIVEKINNTIAKQQRDFFTRQFSRQRDVEERATQIQLERRRRLGGASSITDKIAEIDLTRQNRAENIRRNRERVAHTERLVLLRDRLAELKKLREEAAKEREEFFKPPSVISRTQHLPQGERFDELVRQLVELKEYRRRLQAEQQAIETRFDTSPEGIFAATSSAEVARKQIAEDLAELADLEVEKKLAILEIDKDIAIERKKQADEAARALGLLSDEDKLRVRAQAAFFAARPGKTLSLEDQFLGSASDNQILQRFFPSRAGGLDASSPFGKILAGSDFGISPDLIKAEKELDLARARIGGTDKDLVEDGLKRARSADIEAAAVRGEFGVGGAAAIRTGDTTIGGTRTGRIDDRVTINVAHDAFDFRSVTDAFKDIMEVVLEDRVVQMRDELLAILATKGIRKFEGRTLPPPAN